MKQVNLKFVNSILLIAIGLFVSLGVSAQELTVTGQIVDATGEPVIGANVLVKGTTVGTITDFDGNFSLRVADPNATVQITFIGYQPLELPANSPLFNKKIVLRDDTQLLDDVVIIGYGQVKKGDATGAVLAVKPDEFNKGNLVNPEEALVGKIAGVNVVPGGGAPGDGGTIRIRMGASLSASNDPLIVIDGFPQEGSNINMLNPNDIESFTVLKDASATAIYGSRASNGVIIITTKKGTEGSLKPKFNYNSTFSLSTVTDYLDVLSTEEYKQAFAIYGAGPDQNYVMGEYDTDWQKEVYRAAFGQDHNLSATGAYKTMPYRLSFGYNNQDGIIKTNNFQRTSVGGVITPKFFDKHLSVELNMKGVFESNNDPGGGVAGSAAFFDPTRTAYDDTYPMEDGLGYWGWRGTSGNFIGLAPLNPMADLYLVDRSKKTNRAIGSATFNYKVHGLEDLSFNLNLGFDSRKETTHNVTADYSPQSYKGIKNDGTGEDYRKVSKKRSQLLDFYANYNKDFGKHNLNVMGGYGWQRFWYETTENQNTTSGEEIVGTIFDEQELYLLSFFGRANYSYDNRYSLTATLRADASSRFAKNSRWGYFPSAAFAWRLNNEAFLEDVDVLSDLKLRLSYGQTGQQDIGDYYVSQATYNASYPESSYMFGDKVITTYRPNAYDPNIKWETTETFNIGLDFGFLNNRINGSIDAYKRNTKDLLNEITVPAGSNFSSVIKTNIGNMKSKGVEVMVTAIPVKNKDWEWSITGNFTWADSEITKLNVIENESNFASTKTGSAGGREYVQLHTVGQTPYTFFMMKQAYDDEGNYRDGVYIGKDGNETITVADDDKYLTGKSSLAPYYFGFSTKLSYKNWDLGINAHGSAGNYILNYVKANNRTESLYDANGASSNVLKSTVELKKEAANTIYSDYFLEKGDFLRIDNIRLGYTFTKLWNRSSNLTVSAAVQNVFTITGYSGIDPEVFSGIDRNTYQRPRIYMIGLNLNF